MCSNSISGELRGVSGGPANTTSATTTAATAGGLPLSPSPFSLNQPTLEEVARIRRRRKLARKTPEQRRKLLCYQRRHNERDGRLYYCDYCDIFVSSRHKTWKTHLCSARHLDSFRSYYDLAAHVENVWMSEINKKIDQARAQEVHRRRQQHVVQGAATPLPAQHLAPGIVVGGSPSPSPVLPIPKQQQYQQPVFPHDNYVKAPVVLPSVQVGGVMVGVPSIRVGGKSVMPAPLFPGKAAAKKQHVERADTPGEVAEKR